MLEELIEKINKMEKNIELLTELLLQQSNSLTTYNDVAKFLGVTTKTIRNYIKNEVFTKDQHYYLNENGKTVFIPQSIIDFKNTPVVVKRDNLKMKSVKEEPKRIVNPIVSSMLRGVA